MEPPPAQKPKSVEPQPEHHGLWLGVFIGALLGLLIGTATMLVLELNRRDALDELKQQLQTNSAPAAVPATSQRPPAPVAAVTNTAPSPQLQRSSSASSSAAASLLNTAQTGQAPIMLGSSPADGGKDIAKDMTLSLTFSESMLESALTSNSVIVYENGKNVSDQFKYTYRDDMHRLSLQRDGTTFTPGAQVEIRITPLVKSQKGVAIEQMQTVSFTIAS